MHLLVGVYSQGGASRRGASIGGQRECIPLGCIDTWGASKGGASRRLCIHRWMHPHGQPVGGTHPTEMHPCFIYIQLSTENLRNN